MTSSAALPIAIVGLMGSGKTTVARLLAKRLGVESLDLDELIEAKAGLSVAAFFERDGEAAFRRLERDLLDAALVPLRRVLACGGGVVLDPIQREWLKTRAITVWLGVEPAEAARRVEATRERRPLLRGGSLVDRLACLGREREPLYREVARECVTTDSRPAEAVAMELATLLEPHLS